MTIKTPFERRCIAFDLKEKELSRMKYIFICVYISRQVLYKYCKRVKRDSYGLSCLLPFIFSVLRPDAKNFQRN